MDNPTGRSQHADRVRKAIERQLGLVLPEVIWSSLAEMPELHDGVRPGNPVSDEGTVEGKGTTGSEWSPAPRSGRAQ